MERITVIARPNSKESCIKAYDKEKKAYIVWLKEPADKNKANKELIKIIAKRFGKRAKIVSGATAKRKIIELF